VPSVDRFWPHPQWLVDHCTYVSVGSSLSAPMRAAGGQLSADRCMSVRPPVADAALTPTVVFYVSLRACLYRWWPQAPARAA
jgi:hypothetical protein